MKSATLRLLFVILGKVLFFQTFAKIRKIYKGQTDRGFF